MADSYEFWLNKQIAKMRHTETNYDKHLGLMYDADGNQTDLRKHVNNILYKIATGELDRRYLGGIRSEVALAQRALNEENRLKKIARKPVVRRQPSVEKQQAALLRGFERLEKAERNREKQLWLSAIGMWKPQLHNLYRYALTYEKDEKWTKDK